MHALARLIQQRRREDPTLTYARISELSGDVVTASMAQRLGSSGRLINLPQPRTIRALAKALDVPVSQVYLAAGEAVGLDVSGIADTSSLDGLQADMDSLPTEWQRQITNLVKFAVEQTQG